MDSFAYPMEMKTTSILGLVLVLLGGAVLVVTYIRDELKSKDQAKRFKEVTDGQNEIKEDTKRIGAINAKLDHLIENAEKDNPDILADARKRYVHGFTAFGYMDGTTYVKPHPGDTTFSVTVNWGATNIATDVADDAVIFTFHDIRLTDGVWKVNIRDFEHKYHPIRFEGRMRYAITHTPSGYLVLEQNAIYSNGSTTPVYIVGFLLEDMLSAPVEQSDRQSLEGFTFTPNPPPMK